MAGLQCWQHPVPRRTVHMRTGSQATVRPRAARRQERQWQVTRLLRRTIAHGTTPYRGPPFLPIRLWRVTRQRRRITARGTTRLHGPPLTLIMLWRSARLRRRRTIAHGTTRYRGPPLLPVMPWRSARLRTSIRSHVTRFRRPRITARGLTRYHGLAPNRNTALHSNTALRRMKAPVTHEVERAGIRDGGAEGMRAPQLLTASWSAVFENSGRAARLAPRMRRPPDLEPFGPSAKFDGRPTLHVTCHRLQGRHCGARSGLRCRCREHTTRDVQ